LLKLRPPVFGLRTTSKKYFEKFTPTNKTLVATRKIYAYQFKIEVCAFCHYAVIFGRPYHRTNGRAYATMLCPSVCCL